MSGKKCSLKVKRYNDDLSLIFALWLNFYPSTTWFHRCFDLIPPKSDRLILLQGLSHNRFKARSTESKHSKTWIQSFGLNVRVQIFTVRCRQMGEIICESGSENNINYHFMFQLQFLLTAVLVKTMWIKFKLRAGNCMVQFVSQTLEQQQRRSVT